MAEHARSLLGLDFLDAKKLFTPMNVELEDVDASRAASVLRRLARTGEVDWS